MLLLLACPVLLVAQITQWVSVVEVTDNFRNISYAVMSNEEYTEVAKRTWSRNLVLTKAVRMARDEWIKAEETKDKVFPSSIVVKAEVKRLKTFPDRVQAEAFISELQAKNEEASGSDKKSTSILEKRIKALRDELENPPFGARRAPANWKKAREEELAIWLKELAVRQEKERAVEALQGTAKSLIEAKTDSLAATPSEAAVPAQ